MTHTFTIQVDSAMMKQAWNAWFFKDQIMWKLVVAVGLIAAAVAYDLRDGSLGSVSLIGLTGTGFVAVLFVSAYRIGLSRALSKLDAIIDGKATYTLSDAAISAESSLGSISLAWSAVAELRRYRDLVLVGFKGATYSAIPFAQIPADALAFMIERCRALRHASGGFVMSSGFHRAYRRVCAGGMRMEELRLSFIRELRS